jgi:hypothetical protein
VLVRGCFTNSTRARPFLPALTGTSDESAISKFLDKLVDGSTSFSVPSGDLETLEAALAGSSGDAAKHEEL